ncbi:peptidase S9 [Stenotrophomonas panacihumi]|uniref:Peptidase S9 n=1 Tax=Stenotrophomonas panacihumi TaxID=676599 RepID=A0A0R0ADW5_9GAMM|nr:S9 family peptidase [Stenotrophomonas panacihumi]KRG43152.1 peptidase S9 [Stenotrophomonas panacihumi]PTN53920.1 S9 family peptidase [Stenotrophomonas panacihumi]
MKHSIPALALLCSLAFAAGAAHAQVDIDAYIKRDKFTNIKLSPTGEYLAATLPLEDRTVLVILRRADNAVSSKFTPEKNGHVGAFDWSGDRRVVFDVNKKSGLLDTPQKTYELYKLDVDGSPDILIGVGKANKATDAHKAARTTAYVGAQVVDLLPADERYAVINVLEPGEARYTSAERLDLQSGRRAPITRSPVRNSQFATDNAGVVRFAWGSDVSNNQLLYYRDGDGAQWRMIHSEIEAGGQAVPVGFSEDNRIAYLEVENRKGPDTIVAWDIAADTRKVVLQDAVADPGTILYRPNSQVPVGALVTGDKTQSVFFEPEGADARLYHSLEAAFGSAVHVTSTDKAGNLLLVQSWTDRNPGDFYLFDKAAKKAEHVVGRRDWFDPAKMAQAEPITLKARDGLALHGYLTRPAGSQGKALPMVVMPHGGPFGVFDGWAFDGEAQMLANAGYAVLQVNFRGSGNYGRAFEEAGSQQWGGTMQDDVTDATRWAIQQGYADANRICIYGASYGGYAALMGVAKEPSLYKCAAGYVGVYDLPMMFSGGDVRETLRGETYLREWVGDPAQLSKVSPVNLAAQIKVPVFLAAGGEDERAPIEHTRKMEASLRKAGVPVQTLYYPTEGHGFYTPEHQREYYTQLLAFLSKSLGGQPAKAAPASP